MYNIDTRRCCCDKAKETVTSIEQLGIDQYHTYCQERLESNNVSIHAPIKQNRLVTLKTPKATGKNKSKAVVKALKDGNRLFGRLYVAISNKRPGSLSVFFSHERHEFPPSLFTYSGQLRSSPKADLLNLGLAPLVMTTPSQCPKVTVKVLDGGAVIHTLKPGTSLRFADFVDNVFLPIIVTQSRSVTRLDIVWDT